MRRDEPFQREGDLIKAVPDLMEGGREMGGCGRLEEELSMMGGNLR
jgi:hypothetical protein